MLARVSGGNSGIAEYLENGIKNGRDFTRDELDNRLVLAGDLSLTDSIINSIPDNEQDRYFHITLSFREDYVSEDTLRAITEDYKSMLTTAYKDDEFNFYAEAHLPKIKAIQDKKTGDMVTRKPHIHIVIPKTNLLTGNSFNPFGKYTQSETFHDAIQEKINLKYDLQSPKDFTRQDDDHHAAVISRIKGDFFKEKQGDVKRELLYKIQSTNIRSFDDFHKAVSDYGQVVTRNAGKNNEYLAVKIGDDKKFTNLKSPVFKRDYIENRILRLDKPTLKQVETRLETWRNTASREIKFVAGATPKFRELYAKSSVSEKADLLKTREDNYERRYRKSELSTEKGRQGNNQPSFKRVTRGHLSSYSHGLPGMPQRNVVYGVRGREYERSEPNKNHTIAPERVLHGDEINNLADGRKAEYQRPELRRFDDDQRTRGINTANVCSQILRKNVETKHSESEKLFFADIRKNLDPSRLINKLSHSHSISPDNYSFSFAKDGSARINVGKQNLNVSDFLTKHMNLPWAEAKQVLTQCYEEQLNQVGMREPSRYDPQTWRDYTKEFRPQFNDAVKSMRGELRNSIKVLRQESIQTYRDDRARIYASVTRPSDRKAELSIALVERLKREELIREYRERTQNTITAIYRRPESEKYSDYLTNRGDVMGIVDKLKQHINFDDENSIVKADTNISVQSNLEEVRKEETFLKEKAEKLRMNDLVSVKKQQGVVEYKSQKDGSLVFQDKGDRIVFNRAADKEKIALGLELATSKYGNELKLTGNDAFKQQVVQVAAERGLNIILKPEEYQKMLTELKEQLAAQKAEQEAENAVSAEEMAMTRSAEQVQEQTQATPEQVQTAPEQAQAEPSEHHDLSVIDRAIELNSSTLKEGTDGEFGYMKALDKDENTVYEVMGHAPNDSEDVFKVATFENENDAKAFSEIVNDLGMDKTQSLIDSRMENQLDSSGRESVKEPLVIEYSFTGEGNKFAMSIDGKPAAEVIEKRPEVLDALSLNEYLKQFSREELASGIIDETGKGRALDDVIDMDGNSVKDQVSQAPESAQPTQQKEKDQGMEM
ncbi:relaxase/mobilization nuclease domain-containing protein [Salmonella enterica]|nr:relaxase/mobilization nuclease domain-containing protein [Salmonella enterica]